MLVNSAGILGADNPMFEVQASDWDAVMNVNLKATWQVSKFVADYMIQIKLLDGSLISPHHSAVDLN